MDTLRLSAQIWQEDDAYVVHCPELDVTTQGDTFDDAIAMIRDAVQLTIEDVSDKVTVAEFLAAAR